MKFTAFIPRLGGMHFLVSFIGTVGANAADSGLTEVLESTFSGVAKMLSGTKIPRTYEAVWRNALQTHPPLLDPTDHGW